MRGVPHYRAGILVFTVISLLLIVLSLSAPWFSDGSNKIYVGDYDRYGLENVGSVMAVESFLIFLWSAFGLYFIWSLARNDSPFLASLTIFAIVGAVLMNFVARFPSAVHKDLGVSEATWAGSLGSGFTIALIASLIQIIAIVAWLLSDWVRPSTEPEPYEAPVTSAVQAEGEM